MPSSSTTSSSRKRRRWNDSSSDGNKIGLDVPQIPGVPPDISPILVHAVKSCKKYLAKGNNKQKTKETLFKNNDDNHDLTSPLSGGHYSSTTGASSNNRNDGEGDVISRIMQRHTATQKKKEERDNNETEQIRDLRVRSENATANFLKEVKRTVTNNGTRNSNASSSEPSSSSSSRDYTSRNYQQHSATVVPVACLTFLLDTLYNTDYRVPVRRAGLYLARELLSRSKDCRAHFTTPSILKGFVRMVGTVRSTPSSHGNDDHDDTNDDVSGMSSQQHQQQQQQQQHQMMTTMQSEAMELLTHLTSQYGLIYPRLIVATRYLEERQGLVVVGAAGSGTTSNSNTGHNTLNGMAYQRRIRDVALTYGETEYSKVQGLIRNADECLNVLVPRFGFSSDDNDVHYNLLNNRIKHGNNDTVPAAATTTDGGSMSESFAMTKESSRKVADATTKDEGSFTKRTRVHEEDGDGGGTSNFNDNSIHGGEEEEDEEVDWEDGVEWEEGDEEENVGSDGVKNVNEAVRPRHDDDNDYLDNINHEAAVERTLAVMESSGGLLHGGSLEIDFDTNYDDEYNNVMDDFVGAAQTTATTAAARETLQRCVNVLSARHMPRLTQWVEALVKADGMTLQQQVAGASAPSSSSLVLMPSVMRRKRASILHMLMDIKGNVASVLASAARLGIVPAKGSGVGGDARARTSTRVADGSTATSQNGSVKSTQVEGAASTVVKKMDDSNGTLKSSKDSPELRTGSKSNMSNIRSRLVAVHKHRGTYDGRKRKKKRSTKLQIKYRIA